MMMTTLKKMLEWLAYIIIMRVKKKLLVSCLVTLLLDSIPDQHIDVVSQRRVHENLSIVVQAICKIKITNLSILIRLTIFKMSTKLSSYNKNAWCLWYQV